MLRAASLVVVASIASAEADPQWKVIENLFSAVTIGISFKNDKVGWTSHTDGSSVPKIVRTADGGATWEAVKNTTGVEVITMGVAARKSALLTEVATTGLLESSKWSVDGETFRQSIGSPVVSQDIKFQAGRMVIADGKGVCFSSTGGAVYECKAVPLKYPQTGRYASSPSKDVVYLTAGQWPQHAGKSNTQRLTRNLRLVRGADGLLKRFEMGAESATSAALAPTNSSGYTAELWKSSDGGKTWKNLITDEGRFYFNDIHCFDDTHCVAVGEGFAEDGSTEPGARVYTTSDGEKFTLSHMENSLGTESLMAAKMISDTEHWVGGTTKPGGLLSPSLLLHSTDAGQTYANKNHGVRGQMITNMDFISAGHGYATTVNAMQASSILEYGGSNPPAPGPAPPAPGTTHYEKPPCQAGEAEASVTGTQGKLCAPPCGSSCPTDVPKGVTAKPQCVLKDQSGNQYCALVCSSDSECDVAGGASCSKVGSSGVCTYPGSSSLALASSTSIGILV